MQLIKRHDAQFLVVFIFSLPPARFPLAFSCSYLSQLMRDDRIFREMGDKRVFGLFDFDQAYNGWNGLRGETKFHDLSQGLCKKDYRPERLRVSHARAP